MAQSLTMQTFRDPLASLAIRGMRDRGWLTIATFFALCVHAAIGAALPSNRGRHESSEDLLSELVEVDVARPHAPAPEPAPPEVQRTPAPNGAPRTQRLQASQPVAAAARVVRQNDSVDLTGDGFVEGTAETYTGGTTTANAPLHTPTTKEAATTNKPITPDRNQIVAPAGPDLSRPASAIGNTEWNCPFPSEADSVDDAVVRMRVEVSESGAALGATVLHEPGQGFGREARRCALGRKWKPALDRSGLAVSGSVVVTVHFIR